MTEHKAKTIQKLEAEIEKHHWQVYHAQTREAMIRAMNRVKALQERLDYALHA